MVKKEYDTRFEKFGKVSYVSVSKVNDFIGYLEEGKVMGTTCKTCGRLFFPPRADCCYCLTSDMEWFEVTGTGKLATYSTLRYAPLGYDKETPYTIAVADYGDYKIFGRIDPRLPEEELRVGMTIEVAAETISDGKLAYVFKKV